MEVVDTALHFCSGGVVIGVELSGNPKVLTGLLCFVVVCF